MQKKLISDATKVDFHAPESLAMCGRLSTQLACSLSFTIVISFQIALINLVAHTMLSDA